MFLQNWWWDEKLYCWEGETWEEEGEGKSWVEDGWFVYSHLNHVWLAGDLQRTPQSLPSNEDWWRASMRGEGSSRASQRLEVCREWRPRKDQNFPFLAEFSNLPLWKLLRYSLRVRRMHLPPLKTVQSWEPPETQNILQHRDETCKDLRKIYFLNETNARTSTIINQYKRLEVFGPFYVLALPICLTSSEIETTGRTLLLLPMPRDSMFISSIVFKDLKQCRESFLSKLFHLRILCLDFSTTRSWGDF